MRRKMTSFRTLTDSALLGSARTGIIAVFTAVILIIIITGILAARELKKQRMNDNAEQSAADCGPVPDTDGNN